MLDFLVSLLVLFAAATITALLARRKRDRCLKYFDKKPVFVLTESEKWIWGRFASFPSTIELAFEEPQPDGSGLKKASYVMYRSEIDGIKKLIHPSPKPGTPEHTRWQREVDRVAKPSLLRRLRRWLWNVLNTLRDAVGQAVGMIIGTMKSTAQFGRVAGSERRVGEVGDTLVGTVPNSYEPVLEDYLNDPVVVETVEGDEIVEFCGFLQEYSEKYLLLRDVAYQPDLTTTFDLPGRFDIIFPRSRALVRHRLES